MNDKTIEQRALDLIEKLLRSGTWYSSAIELHQYNPDFADGEELEKEAIAILETSGRWPTRADAMLADAIRNWHE